MINRVGNQVQSGVYSGMIKIDTLVITHKLVAILSEIDEFKGAWRALGTLAPDRLMALQRVATIESIGSSTRIEGSKLSDRDVERLLDKIKINKFETRDEQEVAGYADVIEGVFQNYEYIPITENHIKQLHRDLLRFSEKDERHRGEYKKIRNDVGAFDEKGEMMGIVFETASPFDTPQRMKDLVDWFNTVHEIRKLHPLLITAIFIVIFLEIHPFQDGNGRLSRVLITLLLLKDRYVYVPYASLERVIESNKEKYYLALKQTQSTLRTEAPNWYPWILFFMQSLQAQKRTLSKKIEIEEKALLNLPELAIFILEYVKKHGRITNRDVVREKSASPNTIKGILSSLVSKGLLTRHGAGRAIWYSFN